MVQLSTPPRGVTPNREWAPVRRFLSNYFDLLFYWLSQMDIRYVDIVRDKIIKGRLSSLQPAISRRLRTDAVAVIT